MEKAKFKNLIILILAIANIFLLVIVISNAVEGAKIRAERNEALYGLLAAHSIAVSEDVELFDRVPAEITLKRNLRKEERMLISLIGRTDSSDLGGDIYFYDGVSGIASFRGTGDFELALYSATISIGNDPVKSTASMLNKMGIDCSTEDALVTEIDSRVTVTLNCSYKGEAVFNTAVSCNYTDGWLSTVTGRRLLDDIVLRYTPEDYPDISTIVMNFLSYIESRGEICTEINAFDLGYFAESRTVGSYSLLPVWRISTNTRDYYFDALTGEPRFLNN